MRIPWHLASRYVESVDDYVGVLVPLHRAHLYSASARSGKTEFESRDEDEAQDDDGREDVEDAERPGSKESEREGMLQMKAAEYTIEGLRKETREGQRGQWTTYEIKSKLINKAIGDIGMGTYNWHLFTLCGFGWFADNLWLQGVSLTLPSLSAQFSIPEKPIRLTTSALFAGLSLGSVLWGVSSDLAGRRIAFNATLLVTSVFGVAAAYAQSWGAVCACYAALGTGVGGNLPVDGALFLEFLPEERSSLLTLLSVWWPVGQLASSLVAWGFIGRMPVEQGWRYFVVTIGIVTFAMFVLRFFVFRLFESPKYLLGQGRQAEAVAVVHGIAFRNGTKTWLTSEILDQVAAADADDEVAQEEQPLRPPAASSVLRSQLQAFSADRLKPLFKTRKLGLATGLIWFSWATIGMGYPLFNAFLPQYFARSHADSTVSDETSPISSATYRNYAITSIMGVPGSLLAAYLVDHPSPLLGRRGTLAISTLTSAIFLFLFVRFGSAPGPQLLFSCVEAFAQNIMYGVLYAFTPELFPAPVRGAGTGVASFLNRVAGLMAPVLAATMPGDGATTPVFISATLILLAFVGICLIPIETRGTQRL